MRIAVARCYKVKVEKNLAHFTANCNRCHMHFVHLIFAGFDLQAILVCLIICLYLKKNEGDKIFKNLLFDIRTKAVSCPPREELFPSDNRDELLCD